ncbi:hypothetical protein [Legionella fairfieldensis]|uniref:hypothetical protein n=1 Tax=Legionella fairfieldensis TaxID=45064 RepID=UPI00048F17C4|nr:hypothetical protein [Legionella fairfieldensis]
MERDQDLMKLKELLRHTGEFIAYFELAESKMMEWRHDIEQQAQAHQHKAQQQLQSLHNELDALQEVLTQAGLARFRLAAEKALQQGEEHLELLHRTSQQLITDIENKHQTLSELMEKNLLQVEQHTLRAIECIDAQLMQYDVQHFRRVASDSCEQVERTATNAIVKSERFLRTFQWRAMIIAIFTTIITAFAIGLYINNEFPWEIHQHAMNEREAGKALIHAWPALSQEEKAKILNNHSHQKA